MNDTIQIIFSLVVLAGVFILSRYVATWQMRRAAKGILQDLKNHRALAAETAVELPYAKRQIFKLGLRDYRPKVLQGLVQHGVVAMTQEGKFYLREEALSRLQNV